MINPTEASTIIATITPTGPRLSTAPTVGDVVAVLDRHYPPATAAEWDAVGLVCGERAASVRTVLLTVDVTAAVIEQARTCGADLVIAHHPLLLKGIHAVDVGHPKGRMMTDLITSGIALHCAHTNADVGSSGTVAALAEALGLIDPEPLRATNPLLLDSMVTFVPAEHLSGVVEALVAAGAGSVGDYDRAYFASPGTASFRPGPHARPFVGVRGEVAEVAEVRLEMVLPRATRSAVLAALWTSHPYKQPAYDLHELVDLPSGAGLGRVGPLAAPITLRAFVETVRSALPAWPAGLRIAGDPDRVVRTVAIQAGAGDDLLDAARQAGADVYLTSDLRHHPAGEALAWPDAPALVDVSHWAAEWTWLPVLDRLLRAELAVTTVISELCTDPWTDVLR